MVSSKKTKKADEPTLADDGTPFIPVLIGADGKSAKKPEEKLILTGFEKEARAIRLRDAQMASLKIVQDREGLVLLEAAKSYRRKAEVEGRFFSTVHVACAPLVELDEGSPVIEESPVQVRFSDKFKELPVENEANMRAALGKTYDEFFTRSVSLKAGCDITVDKLRSLLGKNWDEFCTLVEVDEKICAKKGFMELRASMRAKFDDKLNTVVDGISNQIQNKPGLYPK